MRTIPLTEAQVKEAAHKGFISGPYYYQRNSDKDLILDPADCPNGDTLMPAYDVWEVV